MTIAREDDLGHNGPGDTAGPPCITAATAAGRGPQSEDQGRREPWWADTRRADEGRFADQVALGQIIDRES
jgi:hypothetical protein